MLIISTIHKITHTARKKYCSFIFILFVLGLLNGCAPENSVTQAEIDARKSQQYYRQAISQYQRLIRSGRDLHFELGQLYYNHGDLRQAIATLQKSNSKDARKLLGICYYRINNFTDALEVFKKQDSMDDESLYYYGLTCEKLNLFDQAIEVYKKIKSKAFQPLAGERLGVIEKQVGIVPIGQTDPLISKVLSQAPPAQNYPQAGALILHCDEKMEITGENKKIFYMHYAIKILNERGKKDFAEAKIDYDSTDEKVELEYARTIKPDGTVVNVGSRHIRDVSKYLNFPLYSNARVYIISFPEVTEGSVIEYKVKVIGNQLINKKDFVVAYPLQTSEPIISANFQISLPKVRLLKINVLNKQYNNFGANTNPAVENQGDTLIYKWSFKNIPQIMPEANMPSVVEINPAIIISSFSSWQEVYDWWQGLSKDKIKATKAIKDKVTELTKPVNSDTDKIKAIYNFCAQKIRYVAVEYGEAGYEPHKAEDIFKNKYGDCKDQAILLVTMLREAGFVSWPVLISTSDYYNLNQELPATIFNHCIAAVLVNGKMVFLDPTAETCSFGDLPASDQGRRVLVFKDDGYQIIEVPLYPVGHNLVKQKIKIAVNKDGSINADKFVWTYGQYDQIQRIWLLYTPPELIARALEEKIQDISIGAELDKYDIKNVYDLNKEVVLSYSFYGPEYFTNAGNLRIMPQLSGLDTSIVAKNSRRYPIDFGILDSKETIFEVAIPRNFVIKYMPESITENSPWVKMIMAYSQKNNIISLKQTIEVKRKTITQDEYPGFKKFFEETAKKLKQRVVLEQAK